MYVGIIYPETPAWPKLQWVFNALQSLGVQTVRGHGATDFARLSQECDLLILGHKGIGGRWPDLKRLFPLRRATVVQWWFDLIAYRKTPLAEQAYLSPDNHLPLMQACDVVLVKERGLLDEFRSLGINAEYLDQGCPVDCRQRVLQSNPQWDVLIWGAADANYPERVRDALSLHEAGLRVAWAGSGDRVPQGIDRLPWCHPDELPDLCGRAQLVLSCDKRHDIDGYWSDRFWMAAGMGCCVLRRETPGLPDGPYLRYSSRAELIALAKHYSGARSGAQSETPGWSPAALQIGEKAREWCLKNHTLAHRCRKLMELVARTAMAQAV